MTGAVFPLLEPTRGANEPGLNKIICDLFAAGVCCYRSLRYLSRWGWSAAAPRRARRASS
jgi:hypothetical protein